MMSELTRSHLRHALVVFVLVVSVLAVAAARLAPSALERCVDDAAPAWNGTASELWAECSEMVTP